MFEPRWLSCQSFSFSVGTFPKCSLADISISTKGNTWAGTLYFFKSRVEHKAVSDVTWSRGQSSGWYCGRSMNQSWIFEHWMWAITGYDWSISSWDGLAMIACEENKSLSAIRIRDYTRGRGNTNRDLEKVSYDLRPLHGYTQSHQVNFVVSWISSMCRLM